MSDIVYGANTAKSRDPRKPAEGSGAITGLCEGRCPGTSLWRFCPGTRAVDCLAPVAAAGSLPDNGYVRFYT